MNDNTNISSSPDQFEVVGRDSRIVLSLYMVVVHGRRVIDYQKLKSENPELYNNILLAEQSIDIVGDANADKLKTDKNMFMLKYNIMMNQKPFLSVLLGSTG